MHDLSIWFLPEGSGDHTWSGDLKPQSLWTELGCTGPGSLNMGPERSYHTFTSWNLLCVNPAKLTSIRSDTHVAQGFKEFFSIHPKA